MGTSPNLRWAVLGLMLAVLMGCQLVSPATPVPTSPSPTEAATVALEETATPLPSSTTTAEETATSLPALSATPTPVSSSTVNPCPESQDVAPPLESARLDDTIAAIHAYLNEGGDPAALVLQPQEGWLRGDLTGDGVPETVFMLIDPESEQIPPKGHLVIFTCEAGSVNLRYHYEPADWYGLELIDAQDLTQDGVADLAFSEVSCGASTCWHTPHVWSWQDQDFVDLMGAEFQFPYPVYEVQSDKLVVMSEGMGSVGAGPQRPITTELSWTGQAITITDEIVAPPTYRFHAWVDGDAALAAEDYETAAAAYQRVVEDDALEAWGAYVSPEEEQAWVTALGYWRLTTLHAYLDHSAEAEAAYDALQAALTPDTAGYPVLPVAERFWRAYQRDGDVAGACTYAIDTEEAQAIIDFLNTFGYANPLYEFPHLCPFTVSGVASMPF